MWVVSRTLGAGGVRIGAASRHWPQHTAWVSSSARRGLLSPRPPPQLLDVHDGFSSKLGGTIHMGHFTWRALEEVQGHYSKATQPSLLLAQSPVGSKRLRD